MSRAAHAHEDAPETVVRNTGWQATTLHRLVEDDDGEPVPACPEATRPGAEFRAVEVACYPTYDLCANPECFGGEDR